MNSALTPEVKELLAGIHKEAKQLFSSFFTKENPLGHGIVDMLNLSLSYRGSLKQLWQHLNKGACKKHWQQWLQAHKALLQKVQQSDPPYTRSDDRRFRHKSWYGSPWFHFIERSYEITCGALRSLTEATTGLKSSDFHDARFFLELILSAAAPNNFLLTNPELLRYTKEQGGINLLRGFYHLLQDLNQWHGYVNVTKTPVDGFIVGETLATTPGQVVYENERIQLIQYTPTTEKVAATPLLLVGSWINKYYILDLQSHNSFIKWLVDEGFTVFVVSWINPNHHHEPYTFEDYVELGPMAAVNVIQRITGACQVAAIGHCLGGTVLMTAAAYWQAQGKQPLQSVTLLTTLLDFSESGALRHLMGEAQLNAYERSMKKTGMWDGRKMQAAFNLSHSNEYIWLFVQHNYGRGQQPRSIDASFWSQDITTIPGKLFQFYIRELFMKNTLANKTFVFKGVSTDLSTIKLPIFYLGGEKDESNPPLGVYNSSQLLQSASLHFVLVGMTGAGFNHVSGVINPPSRNKGYFYWRDHSLSETLDDWVKKAEKEKGTWWLHWKAWQIAQGSHAMVLAREPGSKDYPPIEMAPGSFVKA